jgi:hypothetical protein
MSIAEWRIVAYRLLLAGEQGDGEKGRWGERDTDASALARGWQKSSSTASLPCGRIPAPILMVAPAPACSK